MPSLCSGWVGASHFSREASRCSVSSSASWQPTICARGSHACTPQEEGEGALQSAAGESAAQAGEEEGGLATGDGLATQEKEDVALSHGIFSVLILF